MLTMLFLDGRVDETLKNDLNWWSSNLLFVLIALVAGGWLVRKAWKRERF
jgi:hypothetical protein